MSRKIIIDKGILVKLYVNEGLSTYQVAKRFNCHATVIQKRLKENGIKLRKPKQKIIISKDRLIDLYVKQGFSVTDTARKLGISHCAAYNKLKENGIGPRKKNLLNITKEELYNLYVKENLSPQKIAEKFNSNKTSVFEKLIKYKIKTKSLSEANTKYEKIKFNGNDELKAYMIGFRLGDLKVKAVDGNSTVLISSNTTKLDQCELIKKVYGSYGHFKIKDYNGVYHIYCNLDKSFNFLINKEDKIPEWILDNKDFLLAFIGGYTDAEGNIGLSQHRARFRIRTYDKKILFQIHKHLNKFGINSKFGIVSKQGIYRGKKQNKDCFGVFVNSKEDLLNLFNFLKPYIKHRKRYGDLVMAENNILERNKK
jgi:predicted DNA-binding protein YlxM (UPF0122 family)